MNLFLLALLIPLAAAQNNGSPSGTTFNWYFVVVVIAVIVLVLPMIYYGRRRRAKQMAAMHQGHSALFQDVANFSGPGRRWNGENFRGARMGIGMGRWRPGYGGSREPQAREEDGLDESGMPPPPYDAGDKPPSINAVPVRSAEVPGVDGESAEHGGTVDGVAVPMRTLARDDTSLRRERDFEALDDDVGDLMRPNPAQFGRERRLEGGMGG